MTLKFIPILLLLLVGFDAAPENIVTDCIPICKTCYSGLEYHCLSCFDGAIWYRSNRYYTCRICPVGCVSCSQNDWCSTCEKGRYGIKCEKHCGLGCKSRTCDRYTGSCTCKPTFYGRKCNLRFRSGFASGGHNREGRSPISAAQ